MLAVCLLCLLPLRQAFAQTASGKPDSDSLVWLLNAKSAEALDGRTQVRKVIGPATFLHNNTYLKCDAALWYVDRKYIDAIGNVSIIQENTVLTSEKMHYRIDEDLAEFRGDVVELKDKDGNILRTRHLDYNTKDSVAVFRTGGSMKDKDGNVIESVTGDYDAKAGLFKFRNNVNMFTDSVFVRTYWLDYYSDLDKAEFGGGVNAWQADNMLSSQEGWYDKGRDLFFFTDKVHLLTEDQEGWSDSLFFNRNTSEADMQGNVQVSDEGRGVSLLSGRMQYCDSPRTVTLTRDPAVVMTMEDKDGKDTVYMAADRIVYESMRKCDVDSSRVAEASAKRASLEVDVIANMREKKRKEAEQKRQQEMQQQQQKSGRPQPKQKQQQEQENAPAADSLAAAAAADSLAAAADSLELPPPPPDTTDIGFVTALRNVRIFRTDLQAVCDSLVYSDLDSLVRMFVNPIIWSEQKNQISADSVFVVINGQQLDKVSFQANAFIHAQEDTIHYNQIKGTEMMAFFNDASELHRFDAMGGVSAVFYLREKGEISLVNQKESKLLSAVLKDGNVQKIYYFEQVKNDIHPIDQITLQQQRLKGFCWQGEKRPETRYDVTSRELKDSQRRRYSGIARPAFRYTGMFFPGYIDGILKEIKVRDSLKDAAEARRLERERFLEDSLETVRLDSLARIRMDSLARADSLRVADSLARALKLADTLAAAADSLAASFDSFDSDRGRLADSLAVLDAAHLEELVKVYEERFRTARESLRKRPDARDERKALRMEKRESKKNMKLARRYLRKALRNGKD